MKTSNARGFSVLFNNNVMPMWIWGRLIVGLAHVIPPLKTHLHQRAEMLWSEWNEREQQRLCQYGLKEE